MMMREQQWDRSNCRRFRIDVCLHQRISVADLEGVQGVRSNPPLEPNYFVFMGNLKNV